jgi:hypothetical protein
MSTKGLGGGGGWSTFSRPLNVSYQKWVSFQLQELMKAQPCRVQGVREIDIVIADDNWQWMPREHGARNAVPADFPRDTCAGDSVWIECKGC